MLVPQKGFILSLALIFLAVIGLYVLTLSEMLFIYAKSLNALSAQHQQFYALEKAVMVLGRRSPNDCLVVRDIHHLGFTDTMKRCIYKSEGYQFEYIWTDLGVYSQPCLKTSHGLRRSHHYDLSVWCHQNFERGLQVHFLKADMSTACSKVSSTAVEGMSSWRELSVLAY